MSPAPLRLVSPPASRRRAQPSARLHAAHDFSELGHTCFGDARGHAGGGNRRQRLAVVAIDDGGNSA
jgi:hypothetical protein